MPRKPPVVMTRKIQLGQCTLTVEARGNPLEYTKQDRMTFDDVMTSVEKIDLLVNGPREEPAAQA